MNLENAFSKLIIVKTILLILIIIWGASVQAQNSVSSPSDRLTDIGGILFSIFSIAYFFTSYFLYRYKYLGKILFLPLVSLFIMLGFITEFFNSSQFTADLSFLFIFYIVSPIFFILQGVLIALLYFTEIKEKFSTWFY